MTGQARALIESPPARRGIARRPGLVEELQPSPGPLSWRQLRPKRVATDTASGTESHVTRLALLLVAMYALTLITISFRMHDAFQTDAFDLGNFDQAIWNTWQGRPFQFTNWELGTTRLAAHVEPILLLIAPLYSIWASPKLLLFLQGIVIALGALPVAWLARSRLQSDSAAIAFAAAYLLYPALEAANLAEFHPVALAAPLLLFAFYFFERGWPVPFFAAILLAMATKEHVPLSVGVLGWYAWQNHRKPLGFATMGIAFAWLVVSFIIVLPSHNPEGISPYLARYYERFGETPLQVLQTILNRPSAITDLLFEPNRLSYVMTLLVPLALLPLLSLPTLALAIPDIALNLLSGFPAQYGFQAHYGAVVVPYLVISAILGTSTLARQLGRGSDTAAPRVAVIISLVVVVLSLQNAISHIWAPLLDHPPKITAHRDYAASVLASIPPDAAVAASSTLNPHLSQRKQLWVFPNIEGAEFIAIDVTGTPYPLDAGKQWYEIQQLLQGDWGVLAADDGVLVLQRGHATKDLPEGFLDFTRTKNPRPQVKAEATFGPSLQLLGYDLEPGPTLHGSDPHARMTLYFRLLSVVEGDPRLLVQVRRPDSELFEQYSSFAATHWYPIRQWQIGDVVRVTVDRVAIGWWPHGTVFLSIMQGDDPETAPRLPATAPRLNVEEGTTIRLLELKRG